MITNSFAIPSTYLDEATIKLVGTITMSLNENDHKRPVLGSLCDPCESCGSIMFVVPSTYFYSAVFIATLQSVVGVRAHMHKLIVPRSARLKFLMLHLSHKHMHYSAPDTREVTAIAGTTALREIIIIL